MDKLKNQNNFLTYCSFSIILLLTLCYFGINMGFRGTFAVESTANCPVGYNVEVIEHNGVKYCSNGRLKYESGGNLICSYTSTTKEDGYTCSDGKYNEDDEVIYECTTNDLSYCSTVIATESTYTVYYNLNGGVNGPSEANFVVGEPMNVSSIKPTKDGYTFKGWNSQIDGKGTGY